METATRDAQLRQAAFSHVNRLAALRGGVLDSADLAGGFDFGGDRIPLINPQRAIFKPRQMEHFLSIKTVFPRRGARVWYDDQRATTHSWAPTRTRQITAGFGMRWSGRSPSSISSAHHPVGISRSFLLSSWDGTPIGYELTSLSG
jgi:hypothetical protein